MRVLAVGNMYPPHHFGGYELVWRAAMRHLEANGHQARVLTTDLRTGATGPDDPNVRRELRWYWRDHGFPDLSRGERVRLERHNARVLRRELRDFRPDVVSWWSMGGMSLSMVERVRRLGIPAVAFVHDDWLDYGRHVDGWLRTFAGRPRDATARLAELVTGAPTHADLERAGRYIFVSETTRRRAFEAGVRPADSGIAHSGIDPDFIDPAPEREWDWSLLYVGRLDERKGVDTAVEALAHLPRATLTLVGGWDEDEERRLRELAERHGVAARVVFAGQRSRADVRAAYADADVVVFPVRWEEPWGLVPLEAMARGRPVVATGRGGSGEYLRDGENALLFEAGDPRGLALAVERLAGDPALRTRLREGGLATAPLHTEDNLNAAVLREITGRAK